MPHRGAGKCPRCLQRPPAFDQARSWAEYSGSLRRVLLSLKYHRDLAMGLGLAQKLQRFLSTQEWEVDAVVPVPLAQQRLMQRGYNQVDLFARPLALAHQADYLPVALQRQKETASQVGLSVDERFNNMRAAFKAQQEMVKGKRIALLDDVMTTGATLSAAAQALRESGASHVYALTIARTVREGDSY